MREEDHMNRISYREDQLPSPEELTPLTQTLITPDLAKAFDITINRNPSSSPPLPPPSPEFIDSGRPDKQALPARRPRLMWTPELHKRFLDALTHLGLENAVPKKILQHMKVDGLTRQNVSSHLQKYRLFLKRMRVLLSGEGGSASLDHLSASMPVPHHFLDQDGGPSFQGEGGENYLPSMPPGNHQMAAVAVETPAHQQQHLPGDDWILVFFFPGCTLGIWVLRKLDLGNCVMLGFFFFGWVGVDCAVSRCFNSARFLFFFFVLGWGFCVI